MNWGMIFNSSTSHFWRHPKNCHLLQVAGVMDLLTVSTKTEMRGKRSPEGGNASKIFQKSTQHHPTSHPHRHIPSSPRSSRGLRYWTSPPKRKTIMKQLASRKLLHATASFSKLGRSRANVESKSLRSLRCTKDARPEHPQRSVEKIGWIQGEITTFPPDSRLPFTSNRLKQSWTPGKNGQQWG